MGRVENHINSFINSSCRHPVQDGKEVSSPGPAQAFGGNLERWCAKGCDSSSVWKRDRLCMASEECLPCARSQWRPSCHVSAIPFLHGYFVSQRPNLAFLNLESCIYIFQNILSLDIFKDLLNHFWLLDSPRAASFPTILLKHHLK